MHFSRRRTEVETVRRALLPRIALCTVLVPFACSPPRLLYDAGPPVDHGIPPVDVATADADLSRCNPRRPPYDTTGPHPCTDSDGDGISDEIEGRYLAPAWDTDLDGTPDYLDRDSDGDGLWDADEAVRSYPGFPSGLPPLSCGGFPANCPDTDFDPTWRNLDSDQDGVSDHDEALTFHTDPCTTATNVDPNTSMPISDLLWAAAGGAIPDPSVPWVVVPYVDRACGQGPRSVHYTFETTVTPPSAVDVFLLVDSSLGMGSVLDALRASFSSSIVPTLVASLGPGIDIRYGIGDSRSFPEAPDGTPGVDYVLHVGRPLTHDSAAVQSVLDELTASGGRDVVADPITEAITQAFLGIGLPDIPGHEADATVQHGCATTGTTTTCEAPDLGWAQQMDPARDCGWVTGSNPVTGFACFEGGRLPIILSVSALGWVHDYRDYCGTLPCSSLAASYGSGGHTFEQVAQRLTERGAYFVGLDVGGGGTGSTQDNSRRLAARTSTLAEDGSPIAPRVGPSLVPATITSVITTLLLRGRQDVTRLVRDTTPAPSALLAGHTAADFASFVTPIRSDPEPPIGADRFDAATFYGVAIGTRIVFDAQFDNVFQPPSGSPAVFEVTLSFVGRAGVPLHEQQRIRLVVPGI